MAITITNTFTDATTIEAADLNTNFTDITNKFSGGIDNSDIASNAAIGNAKLAAPNALTTLSASVSAASLTSGLPGSTTMIARVDLPPPPSGSATWTISDIMVSCGDTGAGTGVISIEHGNYSSGTWSGTDIISDLTLSNGAGANDGNQYLPALTVTSVSGASGQSIALIGVTADSTCLTTNGTTLSFTLILKRAHEA